MRRALRMFGAASPVAGPLADLAALLRTGAVRPLSPRTTLAVAARVLREGIRPDLIYTINAGQDPHRVALVHERNVLTWARLYARLLRLANWFLDNGVRPTDAVAVVLGNRPEFVEVQAACVRVGAVASFINPRLPSEAVASLVERLGPALLVTDRDDLQDLPVAVLTVGPGYESAIASSVEAEPRVPHQALGRVVMFTSGTTGRPKGAVRGFGRAASTEMLGFLRVLPFRRSDVHLSVAPLYHATGSGFLTISQALGSPTVMLERFTPRAFCEAVQQWRATTTAVVPTMLHDLVAFEHARDYDLSSLRVVVCTGARLQEEDRERARELLGDVLYDLYGATEMAWVSVATPDDLRARPGSVGRPVPGVQVQVRDESGRAVPAGEVGTIWARNALAMDGYLDDDDLTSERMHDGFVSVQDVGYLDSAGYLFVVDRADDMLISGGVNVYPAEVELELTRHPRVAESAVFGVPDSKWGERIVAAVVSSGATAPDELVDWCRARLAPASVPKEIRLIDELPKSETGKVLKRFLRDSWENNKPDREQKQQKLTTSSKSSGRTGRASPKTPEKKSGRGPRPSPRPRRAPTDGRR